MDLILCFPQGKIKSSPTPSIDFFTPHKPESSVVVGFSSLLYMFLS